MQESTSSLAWLVINWWLSGYCKESWTSITSGPWRWQLWEMPGWVRNSGIIKWMYMLHMVHSIIIPLMAGKHHRLVQWCTVYIRIHGIIYRRDTVWLLQFWRLWVKFWLILVVLFGYWSVAWLCASIFPLFFSALTILIKFPLEEWGENSKILVTTSLRWMALRSFLNRPSRSNGSGRLGGGSSPARIMVPASWRLLNNRFREFPLKTQMQGLFLFFSHCFLSHNQTTVIPLA